MKCLICNNYENENLKRFSDHIKREHNLTSEEYTIKELYFGIQPVCKACNSNTRYVSFEYKLFCKDHAKLAMKNGGAIGGQTEAWNKGKTKLNDPRIASQALSVTGQGNHFFGKKHSQESIKSISLTKTLHAIDIEQRIIERSNEFELMTSLSEYHSKQKQYLEFKCVICSTIQPKTLQAFERGSRCYVCYPVTKSNWELEVLEYVKKLYSDTVSGDRTILMPKEIDVYVPSKKIGFECHGLYWHSEGSPRGITDKNLTKDKIVLAYEKGVKLYQFFDDEWRDKRQICESIIDHRLGMTKNKIGARKLEVVILDTSEQRLFFDNSHIAGYTPSRVTFGLKDKTGLILAALSLRIPRQKKYLDSYEIARFSTAPNWSVSGGLDKLMKRAIEYCKLNNIQSIMTYVDRRFGRGHGYKICGFKLVGETGVDYWYTDNVFRYDRLKFKASNNSSEKEVAKRSRVSRIFGAGSLIMILEI